MKDPLTGEEFKTRQDLVLSILLKIKNSDKARIQYANVVASELYDFFENAVDPHMPFCYSVNDEEGLLNVELVSDILFYIFGFSPCFKFGGYAYPVSDDIMRKLRTKDQKIILQVAEELPKLLYLSLPLTVNSTRAIFPMYMKSYPESVENSCRSVQQYIYQPAKETVSSILGYMTNTYTTPANEYGYTDLHQKPMLRITKQASFAAAHQLPYHPGLCGYVHGHDWKFEIEIQLPHVNKEGLLIDFSDLKRIMEKFVVDRMDHCFINDILFNPTAENIALWIWKRLSFEVLGLLRVTVWESPTSSATFDLREVV